MSEKIQKQIHFLILFVSDDTNKGQRGSLLEHITKSQLNALSEIGINILKGSVPLSMSQKLALKRHARRLRILSSKKATIAQRKKILTISFVQALLHPVKEFLTHQLENRYG